MTHEEARKIMKLNLSSEYGAICANGITIDKLSHLIAGNQRIELYNNQWLNSENLLFTGSFERLLNSNSEKLVKLKYRAIFQLIGAGSSLIIVLRKEVI